MEQINDKNNNEHSILYRMIENLCKNEIRLDTIKCITDYILTNPSCLYSYKDQWTPYIYACTCGIETLNVFHEIYLKITLDEKYPDVYLEPYEYNNIYGYNLLHYIIKIKKKIIKQNSKMYFYNLLDYIINNIGVNINSTNIFGNTVLHELVYNNNIDDIKYIFYNYNHIVNKDVLNIKHESLLCVAFKRNFMDLFKLLLSKKCDYRYIKYKLKKYNNGFLHDENKNNNEILQNEQQPIYKEQHKYKEQQHKYKEYIYKQIIDTYKLLCLKTKCYSYTKKLKYRNHFNDIKKNFVELYKELHSFKSYDVLIELERTHPIKYTKKLIYCDYHTSTDHTSTDLTNEYSNGHTTETSTDLTNEHSNEHTTETSTDNTNEQTTETSTYNTNEHNITPLIYSDTNDFEYIYSEKYYKLLDKLVNKLHIYDHTLYSNNDLCKIISHKILTLYYLPY